MPIYEGLTSIPDKTFVVIDIGAAYTKLGFSGEFSPRCIIPSEVICKTTGKLRKLFDFDDVDDLHSLLVEFLNILYFRFALISPKDRPFIVVECLLCPTIFRETLAQVLFKYYEIGSLFILPSHLVSLASLAAETALVVDVGYKEAVTIPICHGLPVIHAWQALPIGAEAIHRNIRTLLQAENMGIQNINESILEDIKVRCCFVTTAARAEKYAQHKSNFVPCPSVQYPLEGSRVLNISGKIREMSCEILYDEDNDHQCLSTMILDAIVKLNVDLRSKLAENILLIGGTTMITGFKARLKDELYKQLKLDRYKNLQIKQFKFHSPPSKENYTAWLGGALYGGTDLVPLKAITRETYFKENRLPDWANMKDNSHTL